MKFRHRDRHVRREDFMKKYRNYTMHDEGRGQGDASTKHEMSKIASQLPDPRREAWKRLPLPTLGRHQLYQRFDLKPLPSRN